ncbi:uncharacterized protein [Musca autumnalis]|uniref:uncharacterized protein n=1 Tax=Musca autumnalis TaxID=221902 RepID=UPI003CE932A1
MAFINAYQSEEQLWNRKRYPNRLRYTVEQFSLKNIAESIERQQNIQLNDEYSKSTSFICEFLKSDSNYMAFINAYQSEEQLWNHKRYPNRLRYTDEQFSLKNIAESIERQQNIQLNDEYSKSTSFICEFLKSDSNYMAFINAYQSEEQLWNRKRYPHKLRYTDKQLSLKIIAASIETQQNIQLSLNQVEYIIRYIRNDYKDKLIQFKSVEERKAAAESNTVPKWYFEKLSFLDPYLIKVKRKVAHRRHLTPEHISQILEIYKRFPILWNTNLLENLCTNKQEEAIQQMTIAVRNEMGLKIRESSLKNYLNKIQDFFYRDKSEAMNSRRNRTNEKPIYFEHMMFLNDHIGPFECTVCGRRFKNRLYYKMHLYQQHQQGEPITCSICNKIYEKVEPYVAHVKRHLGDLRDECKICGKRFIRAADLRLHMRTHTGLKPYCCEICGLSFSISSSLKIHLRRHNKDYRVYCEICNRGFYGRDFLRVHMATHTNERNFPCSVCGKAFRSKDDLRKHLTIHVDTRNYPCTLCGKMFKNRYGVKQHMRTHRLKREYSKSKSIICDFLKSDSNYKAFITAYRYEEPLWNRKRYRNELRYTNRQNCLKTIALSIESQQNISLDTNLVDLIIRHIRKDYKEKLMQFKTAEQQKAAADSKNVPMWYFEKLAFLEPFVNSGKTGKRKSHRRHLTKEHILQIVEIYKRFPNLWNTDLVENLCSNKRDEAIEEMTKAVRDEVGVKIKESSLKNYLEKIQAHFYKEKSIALINRGKITDQNSIYFEHMLFLYDHSGPFDCTVCGQRFRNRLNCQSHLYQRHQQGEPLTCSICNKVYENLGPYVAHIRRHMSDLPDECKECGKRFIRRADLRMHMRIHAGIKPYCCEMCGMSFTASSAFKNHIRRHNKDYRVHCEICNKGFYGRDLLRVHMTKHTNERNFPCSVCGKAFRNKDDLRKHETIHVEGRNYPCSLCGKMFKNRYGVQQHLRTHRSK